MEFRERRKTKDIRMNRIMKIKSLIKIRIKRKRLKNIIFIIINHNLLPLLPPSLLVVSVGIGVTSSIHPIHNPDLANALIAA